MAEDLPGSETPDDALQAKKQRPAAERARELQEAGRREALARAEALGREVAALRSYGRSALRGAADGLQEKARGVDAATLHEASPGLPILVVTASGHALDVDALLAAGIADVLPQPPDAAEIAAALAACLARKGAELPA